ncbi:hypothetical protein LO762_30645 [Actinocorallia sp. API 0066]|uniref:hypothetical protein n=1 Tax=Actinocorallia sp. API 0066 TaxID=2896846 RepID=UPI001E2970EF|nr:hypothetical protein [Actinocorallia sp. API 0066]MCD0453511.1 hypothetical protein [Actinocorallia sp. API 0066]
MRALKAIVAVAVMLAVAWFSTVHGVLELKPAWDATRGGGTPGTFQVESVNRNAKTGACGWTGTFTPVSGAPRSGVDYEGDGEHCAPADGEQRPARDTGSRTTVYGGATTGLGTLVGVTIVSVPALLVLLVGGVIGVLGLLSLRPSRRSSRPTGDALTPGQRALLNPRPRTAPPPPGWTSGPSGPPAP